MELLLLVVVWRMGMMVWVADGSGWMKAWIVPDAPAGNRMVQLAEGLQLM